MKIVIAMLFMLLSIIPVHSGESVSFENYLRSFDYQERRNMKIGIPELLNLYKQGRVQIIAFYPTSGSCAEA